MRQFEDSRTIKVSKINLIAKIKENKAKHIKEYHEAVEAYHIEAERQLKECVIRLKSGHLDLELTLVTPINKAEEYDKIETMFNWEIENEVVLSQGEFNQYILDELPFAIHARTSNSFYANTAYVKKMQEVRKKKSLTKNEVL